MALKAAVILITMIATALAAPTSCNSTHPYTLNATGACYNQCPWVPPTMYYAYAVTLTCESTCPSPYFAFSPNQTCVTSCPTSPALTYYDYANRKCVATCPVNTYAAANQSCLATCPPGTWGDSSTNLCVTTCKVGTYYANVTTPLCLTLCPANYYAYPVDRVCYIGGSCPTTPVRYYSDDTRGLCVTACPGGYYADPTNGRCVIYCSTANYFADPLSGTCSQTCANGYYRSSVTKSCVKSCTIGYFADSVAGNCTQICSAGTFGDSQTGLCAKICSLPNFADPNVKLCVSVCSAGLYSDNYTQSCVQATSCYSNTIGDPTTNQCIPNTNCPKVPYMFADLTNKVCTTRCANWGNTVTRLCVAQCPWDTGTYVTWANPDTNQCVTKCPSFPIKFADNSTKTCVATCPQTPAVPYNTYADPTTQSCVRECPSGYEADLNKLACVTVCTTYPIMQFYDSLSGSCVTACPNGYFADTSKGACVANCNTSPLYFAYNINNTCLSVCPTGFFGDNSTGNCVEFCPQTTLQFADSSVNLCVTTCPLFPDTYGEVGIDGNRRCVSNCSFSSFADPLTRLCSPTCNISQGYYGFVNSSRCVIQCPNGTFADNTTGQCVAQCSSFPKRLYGNPKTKTCVPRCPIYYYGNPNNNLCVVPTSCPTGYYADSSSQLCVSLCPSNTSTFGDSVSRKCLQVCPEGTYADSTSRLCSSSCNSAWKLYRDPSTKTCVKSCPSNPSLYADPLTMSCASNCSGGYLAYDLMRTCVASCPANPATFGNYQTMRCVSTCPRESYSFANNSFRGCVSTCPQRVYSALYIVDMFADNSTWSCVTLCPASQSLYNFKHPAITTIRTCVLTCPMVNTTYYFADNLTQSCVTTCPTDATLVYGDIFSNKCVKNCSRNQYRDNTTSRCVYQCSPGYFADNTTWTCVSECPAGLFAETTNQTCATHCPTGFYADNITRYCQSLCDTELFLYSDNTTWQCLPNCPSVPDFYADPNTKLCSISCTGGLFADSWTRSCLPAINCSNSTIGDPYFYRCVPVCPIETPSFLDSNINQCTKICPVGSFADNSTMKCVTGCPSTPDFYAYNVTLANGTFVKGLCVLFCPISPVPYYRHTPTRECLQTCPAPNYFRDTTTLRCVTQCPPFFYAEVIGQICVSNCSAKSKYGLNGLCYGTCPNNTNADPTTNLCVQTCPFGYFSQNNVCVTKCQSGYADPFLKVCAQICSPDYYAFTPTMQCLQDCQPHFKYFGNQTCIISCPASSNLSTNLYMDNTTYSCVNNCLPTWYADNSTRYCTQTCSTSLFADNSTGLCVSLCPSTPDYYGFNRVCYFPCPIQSPILFAENLTRTCKSICPNNSYADNYTRRCVANCTGTQYGWTDGATPICVNICPNGTYGNNDTKTCVANCPAGTYAENTTRLCLERCPSGSFADTHLNVCVQICNNTIPQFADPSSHQCVPQCPAVPSLYGDFQGAGRIPVCVSACLYSGNFTLNTTRLCVTNCPAPFFADPITGDCASYCQPKSNLYADNSTRRCTLCPNVTIGSVSFVTFADPSTMTCVFTCPSIPSLYGDNSTNMCVSRCPALTFGDNDTRLCHPKCFFGVVFGNKTKFTYADNSTNFCVYSCPQYSWADNYTVKCTGLCTLGTFADDSTWKCVSMCPANPISFAYAPTRQCIYACPYKYFASDVGRVCSLGTCPTAPYFYYRDYQNNQCVLKCVYPFFGEVSSQNCVTNCSYGYYQDLGAMACTKCPAECLTCINSGNCTTCKTNLYLYLGQCLSSCPTFPIYYYKYDPSFTCISNCPAPYFGFQGTGKCEKTCPSGYFSNTTTKKCQACPTGCSSCYGTNCSSCTSNYVYVAKRASCSQICSTALKYYLNGACVSSCGSGTFMLDDLVTCQRCNAICAECSKIASNCTKCTGNFWYNYNCVAQCPNNYYVDKSNACQQCSSNPSACALPPLTYTVTVKTINYQLYAYVTFNRAVALTPAQFTKTAQIKTQKGPVKSSDYILSQTSETVYKLAFLSSASLNQLSLSVGFTPGSILDTSGNGLTQVSSSATVPVTTAISPQTQAEAKQMSGQVNIVSWILIIIIMLMMIKSSYPMIVLLDLVQFIHMHVFVTATPLPYLFMAVVSVLKNLNFAFLPSLYSDPNPNQTGPYYSFQPDTTFLGNCQPFVFFLAIFGGAYLLFWLLSMKRINRSKCFRQKIRQIFKARMRYSFLHEIFYYTAFYVFFFAAYQFTGANSSLASSGTNLGAAIIVAILYATWLISITYHAVKYKRRLEAVPKKFSFLSLQASKFPMEIPIRGLFKIMVGCALISPEVSIQLMLLIVFNITMLVYTLCFKPSKSNATNYLNAFIHLAMITYEIVLFLYQVSEKSSAYQNTISYGLFSIIGVTVLTVFAWIIYRLVLFVREEFFGIKPAEAEIAEATSSVKEKSNYEKVKQSSQRISMNLDKEFKEDKDMNISELNFKDEEDRQSVHSIDADQIIQQFAYHHVPKKSEGMIKQEQAMLGANAKKAKEEKRNVEPMVIEIDEDELLQNDSEVRRPAASRYQTRRIKEKAHLRIENEEQSELDVIDIKQKEASQQNHWSRHNKQEQKRHENMVVWDGNLGEEVSQIN